MVGAVILLLVAALLVRWILEAFQEGRSTLPSGARDAELARLREEVDQLSGEVRRLGDEQSFLLRLLADGGAETRPPGSLSGPAEPPEIPNEENP